MKKALVAGALGVTGRTLVHHLTSVGDWEVIGLSRRNPEFPTSAQFIAVDLLNRSLLTDFLPAQGARGLSLYLVDRIGPLRRALMREGVAPAASQPRLMRGEMV